MLAERVMSSYELLVQLPMSAGERGWSGVCVCVCVGGGGGGGGGFTIKRKARHGSWSKAGKKCYHEAWNTLRCLLFFERPYTSSRASKVLTNFDIQGPAIFLGILAQL